MTNINVIRAWKDAKYRNSLSAAEQAMIPANPVGRVELSDAQLDITGGAAPQSAICSYICTLGCTYDSSSKCATNILACTFTVVTKKP